MYKFYRGTDGEWYYILDSLFAYSTSSTPVIVVDRDGRIIIVLVPPPSPGPAPPPPRPGSSRRRRQEESFTDGAHEAYHVVEKAAEKAKWAENQTLPKPSGEETQNRRGDYKSFNLGWSMGCGAKVRVVLPPSQPTLILLETCSIQIRETQHQDPDGIPPESSYPPPHPLRQRSDGILLSQDVPQVPPRHHCPCRSP